MNIKNIAGRAATGTKNRMRDELLRAAGDKDAIARLKYEREHGVYVDRGTLDEMVEQLPKINCPNCHVGTPGLTQEITRVNANEGNLKLAVGVLVNPLLLITPTPFRRKQVFKEYICPNCEYRWS